MRGLQFPGWKYALLPGANIITGVGWAENDFLTRVRIARKSFIFRQPCGRWDHQTSDPGPASHPLRQLPDRQRGIMTRSIVGISWYLRSGRWKLLQACGVFGNGGVTGLENLGAPWWNTPTASVNEAMSRLLSIPVC